MTHNSHNDVPDYLSLLRLDGRGFVVLGAGQGIGEQTVHALAQADARVLCVDRTHDCTLFGCGTRCGQ
ncbi:hypothetical protein [Paraburkholderia sp. GAS348]|uniref:hypothetical protein n=1 Tax=Paraburkholderia sp. GAS348 TaxID=3035132 RepID=UPI003D1DD255